MRKRSLFKAFDAAQARTSVTSREPSDLDAEFVEIHGWRAGYSVIGTIKLLRGFGYSLKEAKRLAERIMEEDRVRIALPDYVRAKVAAGRLNELGANAKTERIKIVHVIPHENRWAVQNQGATKATKLFSSYAEARSFAIKMTKKICRDASLSTTGTVNQRVFGRSGRTKNPKPPLPSVRFRMKLE